MNNDDYQELVNNILIEIKNDYLSGCTKTKVRLTTLERETIDILEEDLSSRGYSVEFEGEYIIIYHPEQEGINPAELRELIEKINSCINEDDEAGVTRVKLKDKEQDDEVKEALDNWYTDRGFSVQFMGDDIVLTHPDKEDEY